MKRLTYSVVVFLFLLGMAPAVWAGPAEEIAEIGQERAKAFREGNLDVWMAAYADNAVLTSAREAFRVEGKEAIRGYFVALFETYPKRSFVGRQPLTRVYNNETTVVQNAYVHLTFVDRTGQVTNLFTRVSLTWVKMGGQWRIVDTHVSRLP